MNKKPSTIKAETRLHNWANWMGKLINALGYSSENHIVQIGLPHNPINRQLGDLSDLPMMVANPKLARLDHGIKQMSDIWQTMIKIKYIGIGITEEDHMKKIGYGKVKYYNEWTNIYKKVNTL